MTYTIALVGLDRSGKTSITRHLEEFSPLPCKYLYMGQRIRSSNVVLPTTRLALYLESQILSKKNEKPKETQTRRSNDLDSHYSKRKRGLVRIYLSLLNRILEAYSRQMLSWIYQLQGYIVVYDRHFLIEAAAEAANSRGKKDNSLHQLEYWIFRYFYPRPDLIIFLDVPYQVLFDRDNMTGHASWERRRTAILETGKRLENFAVVDANRPLERVITDITKIIGEFVTSRKMPVKGRQPRA